MQTKENLLKEQLENISVYLECYRDLLLDINEFIENIPSFDNKPHIIDFWNTSRKKDFYISLIYMINENLEDLKPSTDNLIKEV